MASKKVDFYEKIPFEEALNKTGFGFYNIQQTAFTGLVIISFTSVAFGSSIIVPASACELNTTGAQQGVLAASPLVGTILGAFIWGFLGDTRGRRRMLFYSLSLAAGFNALASLSVNWIMLMVLQFMASVMSAGKHTLSITLLSECLPLINRNVILLIVTSISMLSQGLMALLGIPIIPLRFSYYLPALGIYWNSWRTLMLVYCTPNLVCLLWLCYLHESPKFLLMKGKEEKALEVLKAIYSVNYGKADIGFDVQGLLPEAAVTPMLKRSPKDQIVPLFKPPLIKYTAIMATLYIFEQIGAFTIWLPTIANRFIQIVSIGEGIDSNLCRIITTAIEDPVDDIDVIPCSIDSNALLIVFGIGVLQALANLVITAVVNRLGRRHLVMIISSVCGISGIIINLIPNAIASSLFFVIFAMGTTVLGLYTAIAVALFPTNVRAMTLSITTAIGRIATFAVIQILNYLLVNNCQVGFYVFATIFASSALVVSLLPDDRLLKTSPPVAVPPIERDNASRL